jgi:hypothetical protein
MYHQPRIIRTTFCLCIAIPVIVALVMISCDGPVTAPQTTVSIAATTATPTPTIALPSLSRYETGMVAPAWNATGYSNMTSTLTTVHKATANRWVELPILLSQATDTASTISASSSTITPSSLALGIQAAHKIGLRVFVVPIFGVQQAGGWAGVIAPGNVMRWFSRFWQAWKPYVTVAQRYNADQLAIGTEESWLQNHADVSLWNTLIGQVSGVYHGRITFDCNWGDVLDYEAGESIPSWMHDSRLSFIGVSEYIGLIDTPQYVAPSSIPSLFRARVLTPLDAFSEQVGKTLIISEIGYRATSDALYHPHEITSNASLSQDTQASAYDAALTNLQRDSHIDGVFPWAWTGSAELNLKGTKAVETIRQHYIWL